MRLTQNIYLDQQQKLMMTPELRLAIAILQMSSFELNELIQAELEENPFLEEVNHEGQEIETAITDKEKKALEEWIEYFSYGDKNFDYLERSEEGSFENLVKNNPTLYEHLDFQLQIASNKLEDLIIGSYLIGNIDNNGYLVMDITEISQRLQVEQNRVEEVLALIQTFHPYGIGARNLAECLLIQYKLYGYQDDLFEKVISDHMEDIARGSLQKIAQAINANVQEVQRVCDLIRSMNPRPGLEFTGGNEEVKYVFPDIRVEKVNQEFVVFINDNQHPQITFNKLYEGVLRQKDTLSPETVNFLEEKVNSAIWLIKSIEQRRMTIYKIAQCIVEIQRDFLEKGIKYLKPLTLKDVAEKAEVHESTVSRASNNKYIETPQGLFELKYFFSSSIHSYHTSGKVSSRSVKSLIRDIIDNEDKKDPYTDQAIVQLLARKNIRISRRTIAKYRQELNIKTAQARRRYE